VNQILINRFKENFSIACAETRNTFIEFKRCKTCGFNESRVILQYINKNGYWEYQIKCNNCNEILFNSIKGRK
jgi:hypothetical protein